MKSRRGFTLAELMIIMAITVVMAAAAIPAMGGSLEAIRNKDRETRISAAVYDAYLYALKQGGTTVTARMPDGIIDDMRDYVKTENLSVSFGKKVITVKADDISSAYTGVSCKFEKDDTGTFQLSELVFS